ncbi:hypothetical protein FOXYSP1_03770 [Fusarium oxysporum f. sp. phaseoli]
MQRPQAKCYSPGQAQPGVIMASPAKLTEALHSLTIIFACFRRDLEIIYDRLRLMIGFERVFAHTAKNVKYGNIDVNFM